MTPSSFPEHRQTSMFFLRSSIDAETEKSMEVQLLWFHIIVRRIASDTSYSGLNIGFKHYLQMPNLRLDSNPLEFWKKNKENWHELHSLAMRFLTTSATSVLCERLFSSVGNTITDKRSSLKPKTVNCISFLHSLPTQFEH